MESEQRPHVEVSVGGKLIPLNWDTTDVYIFTNPDFRDVSHIYTQNPDNPDNRVILFGCNVDTLEQLVGMGYRLIEEECPSEQDLEWWVQWQALGLSEELENLNQANE